MYIETSAIIFGQNNFISFERTDINYFTNITVYFKRFSGIEIQLMGPSKIPLLLSDKSWSIRYNIHMNDRCSDSSTDWNLVNLNFTMGIYGIKLIYDEKGTTLAHICFIKN